MQIGVSSFQAANSYAQVQTGGNSQAATASANDSAQARVAFTIPVQTVQAPRPAEVSDKATFVSKKDDGVARDDRKAREADGKPGRLLDIFA